MDIFRLRRARPRQKPGASLQWILGHLPLTAAIAAMGAAMVSLVHQAHDGRTPAATAWVLCAGAVVVLCATVLLSIPWALAVTRRLANQAEPSTH